MKAHAFLLAVVASVACAVASTPDATQFDRANTAYQDGKYVEAREAYESLISTGKGGANVYYNLGNTDARIGAQGLAILNYERALVLDPSHSEARANLKFLRDQSTAKVPADNWKQRASNLFTLSGWVLAASILAWIVLFLIVIPIVRRRRLSAVGLFGLVIAISATAAAVCGAWFTSRELDAAIIIVKQIEARRAPADRAELADVLPSGSRVRWLSERSGWVECELPDGTRGWVPAASVERIRPTT